MNEPVMKKPTTGGGAGGPQDYQPAPGQFPPSTDRTLSGQQLQAIAKNHADALAAIKRDVELRKWAVDQALSLVAAQLERDGPIRLDPMKVSREIHAFLVEAAEKPE